MNNTINPKIRLLWISLILLLAVMAGLYACNDNVNTGLEESLELYAGLEEIPEATSSNITIHRGTDEASDGWFQIEIENVDVNPFIKPGVTEAWCLEWKKTLRSDGDTHQGVKWFTTHDNDKWKPMNYFFRIRDELKQEYPDMNNREIQAVIWTLAGNMEIAPEFNILSLPVSDLPSRLRTNGTVNIDRQRVADIVNTVMNGYEKAEIEISGIVGQTASDEQDIFIPPSREYSFNGPVFDILALPNGNLLVPDFATIKEIHQKENSISDLATLPVVNGPGVGGAEEVTFINGLTSIGGGSFFASRSGLDLALGAALFKVSPGNSQIIGDIESFTLGEWPDGDPGQAPDWVDFGCEVPGGYSAGPQSNPYHITAISGSDVLVADAAGNVLLLVRNNGSIEVVATFDPIVDPNTGDRLIQFPLDEDTNCPVEPVPTSIAVGSDGAYYVGELTGSTAGNFGGLATPEGIASIWRIEPGSSDITCPSANCTKAVTGLNSVIDIEFGPDGYLYVVEFEKNGFLAAVAPDLGIPFAGGAVKKCDVSTGNCDVIEEGMPLPGAITFDKWDNLWLVDNVFAPTIRQVSYE